MTESTRLVIAYALIGTVFFASVPVLIVGLRRRRREKLRRRGIKRFGH